MGAAIGLVACTAIASLDEGFFQVGVFGIHLSMFTLGILATVFSVVSRLESGPWPMVPGIAALVIIPLIYFGQIGFYAGTLIIIGASSLAIVSTDLGKTFSARIDPLKGAVLSSLMAAGTLLLWTGAAGLSLAFIDFLDVLNLLSGAAFSAVGILACSIAKRDGGYPSSIVVALTLMSVAGTVSIVSSTLMWGDVRRIRMRSN